MIREMADKRHWFFRERRRKPRKVTLRLTRVQWKFLEWNKGVEASLDAEFGKECRRKVRFTEL